MLRSFILVITLLFSGLSVAATDFTSFFTPVENDYSIYIISKIFGDVDQNVLPGEAAATGSQLMGNVFRVFNQVALVVGVLMVLYTLVLATLHTAHHGKMMGEKMSSMWVPIRVAFAIAMLVPKANGYCLAQVVVMWLVVQGIGAADTVWNTALQYFEDGGSIGPSQLTTGEGGQLETGVNDVYMNLLNPVLQSATCVAAHNENRTLSGSAFVIYTVATGNEHYIKFGRKIIEAPDVNDSSQAGFECGYLKADAFPRSYFEPACAEGDSQCAQDLANMANAKQMTITYDFARSIEVIGNKIGTGHLDTDPANQHSEYDLMEKAAISYVSTMVNNQGSFTVPEESNKSYTTMGAQGWITAGNYYQVLASIESNYEFTPGSTYWMMPKGKGVSAAEGDLSEDELKQATDLYNNFMKSDYAKEIYQDASPAQQAYLDIKDAMDEQDSIFGDIGMTELVAKQMEKFIDMISGANEGSGSQDPIVQAAQYGQGLMKASVYTMLGLAIVFPVMGAAMGWCTGQLSLGKVFDGLIMAVLPFVYGLTSFLYMQGSVLGVFLPLIPFIVFTMGAIGWIFAVVECMIAAPLIALGMTMPEGHEVYGKADPAIMLLLNMFMRPTLMIMGFLSAMMVTWLAMELINLSFYTAVNIGGIATDWVIGPYITVFMYMGVTVTLVTKVFELINLVPDKVLRFIGDNSQSQGSAMSDAATHAAKQGGQEMSKQGMDSAKEGSEMSRKTGAGAANAVGAAAANTATGKSMGGGKFGGLDMIEGMNGGSSGNDAASAQIRSDKAAKAAPTETGGAT